LAIAIAVVAVIFIRRAFRSLARFIARIPWRWVIVGTMIFALVVWGGSCAYHKIFGSSAREEVSLSLDQQQEDERPSTAAPTAPAQQTWTFQVFEQLPNEGKRVYLYPGWAGFPLGGRIKYKTPNGTVIVDSDREVLKPTPAESKSIKQEGWYTFYPFEGKGVRIYNRW
jgi:hypothetical protein